VIPTSWLLPVVEILHGAAFLGVCIAGPPLFSSVAPKGLEVTSQTVFYTVFTLGGIFGSVAGGFGFSWLGPSLFFVLSAISVVSLLTLLLFSRLDASKLDIRTIRTMTTKTAVDDLKGGNLDNLDEDIELELIRREEDDDEEPISDDVSPSLLRPGKV